MPEFSPACQSARAEFQRAMDAYYHALDAHHAAKSALRDATAALERARRALGEAQAARDRANADWDAFTEGVRADPTLGVPQVEAGVQPPDAPPPGVSVAGPFQTRVPPSFNIWAAGDPIALNAWSTAAANALQRAVDLRVAARAAESELATRTTEHATAAAAHDAALRAEQDAASARAAASEAGKEARARVEVVCEGEVATSPIDGGGELSVEPGVLPDDERRIRDRLDELPAEETDGIDDIELRDEAGPESEQAITGHVSGHYIIGRRLIRLFVFGHSEKTLKHEVGHHVYYHRLTEAARERWDRFYADGRNGEVAPAGKMPNEYAATEADEGFAEAYEHYRDGKRLDPDVERLIEELLRELR